MAVFFIFSIIIMAKIINIYCLSIIYYCLTLLWIFSFHVSILILFFYKKICNFVFMSRRILHFEFPKGVDSVFIEGRRYTKAQFERAKEREKRRDKKGRFVSLDNF
jgi:hypothetical protein